jgi:hypothetical protein
VNGSFAQRRQALTRLVLIVSRTEPQRYTYLKHVFGGQIVDVILDRRVQERRQLLERRRLERATADRRCEDRRQRDITGDLQTSGWALVRI